MSRDLEVVSGSPFPVVGVCWAKANHDKSQCQQSRKIFFSDIGPLCRRRRGGALRQPSALCAGHNRDCTRKQARTPLPTHDEWTHAIDRHRCASRRPVARRCVAASRCDERRTWFFAPHKHQLRGFFPSCASPRRLPTAIRSAVNVVDAATVVRSPPKKNRPHEAAGRVARGGRPTQSSLPSMSSAYSSGPNIAFSSSASSISTTKIQPSP